MTAVESGFQLFVEDTFVRRVHVDKDEAAGVLGEDVDAVQLGDGVAERRAGRGGTATWIEMLGGAWVDRG